MTSLDTSSDIPTYSDCCQQRFPQATAYGRYRVTKLPFACGRKLSHPWCWHNTFHLPTQALQILILLIFLIAWDKVAAGTATRLHLPLSMYLWLRVGQIQPRAGAAGGFWSCLMQNRLPINFPWFNLAAELGRTFLLTQLVSSSPACWQGWYKHMVIRL